MRRFYDTINNRLVYVDNKASSRLWDSHWEKYDIKQMINSVVLNRMVLLPTAKYLPTGSCILEGGCGLGQNVWSLHKNGYDVYGVDYADETVAKVNSAMPELNVSCGDVRKLKFDDDYFDGYWSLGVIEHFYKGFDAIANEMKRVINPGGYLFLTFPCMSRFRKKKAKLGKYRLWEERQILVDKFYQFALSVKNVEMEFAGKGFKLVQSESVSGLKGFKDEIEHKSIKKLLQKLYDSTDFTSRGLAWGVDKILSPFAGHCQLLIFKNLK